MRAGAIKEAAYDEIKIEPRLDPHSNQRRADISFIDNTDRPVIQYITDDCIGHPLSPSHLSGDLSGRAKTLDKLKANKTTKYSEYLASLRAHPSVTHGHKSICFRVCAFTSLGEYGPDTVKFINAAAKRVKDRTDLEAWNGLSPTIVSARFRFFTRAKLQAAIMKGNAIIACSAGL